MLHLFLKYKRALIIGTLFLVFTASFGASFLYIKESSAETQEEREARLRAELAVVEKEIAEQRKILSERQRESASLERDVAILNAKIKEAELVIRAKNLSIQRLGKDINTKAATINELTGKIDKGKESLAQLVRKTNEIDSVSLVEVILSSENISSFFSDLDSFDSIKKSMQESFEEIRTVKAHTEDEKEQLEDKKSAETDAKQVIEAEKKKIAANEAERRNLLKISKNKEKEYESVIRDREAKAAEIRNALFSLRDTGSIQFGTAYNYAVEISAKTGVRPAFLLAIITQESNLGKNVGTCNRPQDKLKWFNIMPGPEDKASGKSGRDDQTVYLRLMKELGLNPDSQPLSCPYGGGWGGAMGPAQFIPTTWASYQARIAQVVGKAVPNPWSAKDAFTASALLLSDLGASRGGYSAERNAACMYYSGRSCGSGRVSNTFYGDQVIQKAAKIQADIDVLQAR